MKEITSSIDVQNFWKQNEHEVLGLAIFDTISDPNQYKDLLRQLPTSHTQLLLMAVSGGQHPSAWIASRDDATSCEFQWLQVNVGNQSSTRKRNDKISVVHADKVGVTFDDEVGTVFFLFICKL